jgi:hypothetical protein
VTPQTSIKFSRIISLDEAEQEMTTKPTYLKSNFLDRQKREKVLLHSLYNEMPVGIEQRFMRASRLATHLGIAASFVDSAARVFESLGILTRRLEFGAKDSTGKTISGRSYHWTLLISKENALLRLQKYHEQEQTLTNKAPAPKSTSLKTRIMWALSKVDKFETMEDLLKAIRRNGENIDFHNMKHVMESLVREGKISFDHGTTNEKIPYNIRMTKVGTKSTQNTPLTIKAEIAPEPEKIVPEEEQSSSPFIPATDFPTITKLVNRRERLENASYLAESAEEEDLAILLMERANKPFTTLEQEAIDLYTAFMISRNK